MRHSLKLLRKEFQESKVVEREPEHVEYDTTEPATPLFTFDDKRQIESLYRIYDSLLRKKQDFIDAALKENVTPRHLIALDGAFIAITQELKAIDDTIATLITGKESREMETAKPLLWYIDKEYKGILAEIKEFRKVERELQKANANIVYLKSILAHTKESNARLANDKSHLTARLKNKGL